MKVHINWGMLKTGEGKAWIKTVLATIVIFLILWLPWWVLPVIALVGLIGYAFKRGFITISL